MQSPKVVVIGAGSIFFGRQAIWQMTHSDVLKNGTLALVDTNETILARMVELARKVIAHRQVPLRLEASTQAREVLADADFVVFSFADRSVHFRGIDCDIALKYGVRMCSGDTIGPGGIMRTLREFPKIMAYCDDIRRLCPEAWVINYINPTAANGIGLQHAAADLKSFALCDGLHMPRVKRYYARRAGIIGSKDELTPELDARFDFRIAGPNHFTWLLKADFDGEDKIPIIAECLRRDAARETDGGDTGAKALYNDKVTHALYRALGFVPTCTGHTKEYVRFWQGLGKTPEPIPELAIWETTARYEWHASMWREVDGFNLGVTPIANFTDACGPDHATDIIETMWAGLDKPFFINTLNHGAVPNMPADAFLEMLCDVTMDGPVPRLVGEAPIGLRGLWQQVLDTHELSARAAMSGDRDELFTAFVCDPLISSLADARRMMEELLEAERDALPDIWFK